MDDADGLAAAKHVLSVQSPSAASVLQHLGRFWREFKGGQDEAVAAQTRQLRYALLALGGGTALGAFPLLAAARPGTAPAVASASQLLAPLEVEGVEAGELHRVELEAWGAGACPGFVHTQVGRGGEGGRFV